MGMVYGVMFTVQADSEAILNRVMHPTIQQVTVLRGMRFEFTIMFGWLEGEGCIAETSV